MQRTVISAQQLSKRFVLEGRRRPTGREALENAMRAPVRALLTRRETVAPPDDEDFWALRDISFEVSEGEILGVVGRNGAGKSVLLRILARVTKPTRGRAEIRGRVAPLLQLGAGFHPDLTGRENITLNGTILGMRLAEARRRIDQIVVFSGIEEFVDTPIKFYSSGMRMRLAFSVAAHLERDIFLLDEVLAVGDIDFKEKCLARLRELARQGKTILFVGHGDETVERFCTRAILLDRGRMVACGRPAEINRKYHWLRNNAVELCEGA